MNGGAASSAWTAAPDCGIVHGRQGTSGRDRRMPKHAAAALEDTEDWNEPPTPEEIERRRRLLAEIRALRSHPLTEEERDFWRKFDEEVTLEKSRGRGAWPPLNAPVTPEEMEH